MAGVLWLASSPAWGGPADVVAARARCDEDGRCVVQATVRHADEGWDHYADGFEVLTPDGEVIARRVLRHPHVDEQPFTRALPGIEIPAGVDSVRIRAHDSVHGFGGEEHTEKVLRRERP
jgi:hypothetical protein